MNEIIYRKNSITNADIVTGNCLLSHAMTGDTLAADTLDFRVWSDTGLGKVDGDFFTATLKTITTADGFIFRSLVDEDYTKFVPGSTVGYKRDGSMVGQFYLRDVKRVGKHMYDFTCISAIGILGDTMHYGGIYTGQTVAEVAPEILEGLPYEIDPIVGDIKLYGWLPIDTKRNNLQQITIATAIAVRTKPDGTLLLTALSNDIKGNIGAGRMAIGGNVAVETPYSAVQVSEHYYQEIAEEIVLFSESSVKTEFLKFNEPVHDLTVTGGTLIDWGANYAIVECNGFTEVKAQKYLHTTRTVTIGTIEGLPSDKIYSVNNATLITSLNSSGVAQKLYEAYAKPATIQAGIFFGNEKAGDVVGVVNPHTEETESAFLKKQDINISNLSLANSDFIVDFTPSGAVTGYKNRVLINSGASWTVPAGITEILIILVGGGNGGYGGGEGAAGSASNGGAGGIGGDGGPGASILVVAIPVTPLALVNYTLGAGGIGGLSESIGSEGIPTVFGSLSSADGQRFPYGYVDPQSGIMLGSVGSSGINGGQGSSFSGTGPIVVYKGVAYYPGAPGANYNSPNVGLVYGGRGGGAAAGSDGGPGEAGDDSELYTGGWIPTNGAGGAGASGANNNDAVTNYGQGGHGGHGGGGGGAGRDYTFGGPGPGGVGGQGSNGNGGCIVIYY